MDNIDWNILSNLDQSISDFLNDYKKHLKENNINFYNKLTVENTIDYDGNKISKLKLLEKDLLHPKRNSLIELQQIIKPTTNTNISPIYLSELKIEEDQLSLEEKKEIINEYIINIQDKID
jgi:hypothetical protein